MNKTDSDWKRELTPEQYRVLRQQGTERPGSSPLNHEHRPGAYFCAGCGAELFDAGTKFDAGCGWPSFYESAPGAVKRLADNSHGMRRVEVRCAACEGHLGHVFEDGPLPTGERFCMNGVALNFKPEK